MEKETLYMHPPMGTSQPVVLTRWTGGTKLQIEMCSAGATSMYTSHESKDELKHFCYVV